MIIHHYNNPDMKRKFYSIILPSTSIQKSKGFFSKLALIVVALFFVNSSQAQSGEALDFDGNNDVVNLPFVVSGSYTKEAWVNPSTVSGFPNILTGSQTALFINNGQLAAGHAPGFNQVINPTPASISAGTWTHIAVTYDAIGGTMSLYQNGVLVSSAAAPSYTETTMQIGSFSSSNFYGGKIDEVRFWSRALSGAEIAATMNCALTGDEPFLLAYYNFNEGIAGANNAGVTTLVNAKDGCTANDGTLVNFALNGPTSNWVAPGATISSNCPGAYENINVTGNSVCIETGDMTPSLLDFTDFGDYGYNPLVRTFIIQNTGSATLNISGATITGVDAADFTITSFPAATVAPGGSTSITISFTPTGALTARNAIVTINNSDTDEAAYTFAITGFNRGPGQALSFDGIDDSVYLPTPLSGSYTKEAWINTAALTSFPNIITGDSTALFLNNGKLAAGHAPAFNDVVDNTNPPIIANTWVHIAVTYDAPANTMKLYRDGILVATNTAAAPYLGEHRLLLGTFAGGNFYSGLIDEVRIWNTVRTAAEIAGSMNCNLTGDEFFLLAYYKFNQGAAGGNNPGETTLADSSDKCVPLNGTLYNFALSGPNSNWVAPGSPVTGTCSGAFENISISGNGNCITSGDNTPSTTDATDFGTNLILQNTDQTFTITNTGSATLNITLPLVITGPDAALFSIITQPAATVAPGASTTFVVSFMSPVQGTFHANVTTNNSDLDEAAFNFDVQASASFTTPVTLLSFNGALKGSVVKLNWKTSAEHNNRGFDVLRSNSTQTTWEKIGYVAGTNSSTGSTYGLTDYAPLKRINTYRLRQSDADGRLTYSDIVLVNNTDRSTVVSAYPNPFQQTFNIIFNDVKLLNTVAKVQSVMGSTVAKIMLNNYHQEVDLSKLAPGMYFISFDNGDVIRLIKQ